MKSDHACTSVTRAGEVRHTTHYSGLPNVLELEKVAGWKGNSWGKTSSLQRWKHIGRALLLVYSLAGESGVDIGQHW